MCIAGAELHVLQPSVSKVKAGITLPQYATFLPKQLLSLWREQGKYLESEAAIGTAIGHGRVLLSRN